MESTLQRCLERWPRPPEGFNGTWLCKDDYRAGLAVPMAFKLLAVTFSRPASLVGNELLKLNRHLLYDIWICSRQVGAFPWIV